MRLKNYNIALIRVVFQDKSGSKIRPILVIRRNDEVVFALSITSQYASKSPVIQQKYFRIVDWVEAGLRKPSRVDTISILEFDTRKLNNLRVIGELTQRDKIRFMKFYREVLNEKDS